MIVFPKAKINIGLRIKGRRHDGYHDIETLFYPVDLCDALEFIMSDENTGSDILKISGIRIESDNDDNLVSKTVRKLRENHSFPFLKINLHKAIPTGSGLGGGSSDAACMLKALNRYFRLSINDRVLKETALELGSDCPFFIDCIPSYATGRGEILTPAKPVLTGYYLVLLHPGIGIDTREAYQNCHPQNPTTSIIQLAEHPITEWKDLIINDFEDYAFRKNPFINEIKNELYNSGALFSLMSGSGSSVYGIFPEKPKIKEKLKYFIIWEGKL